MSDIRMAWRSLIRTPGATFAAVLTVALGIGVNVALLSVLDRLMFRPLPYAEPERLVQVHGTRLSRGPGAHVSLSQAIARKIRERATSFDGVAYAGVGRFERPVEALGNERPVFGYGPENLLEVLGVRLMAGNVPRREDFVRGERPLLLTYQTWRTNFGGRPDAVGAILRIRGFRHRIAGVLPPDFLLPSSELTERIHGLVIEPNRLENEPEVRLLIPTPIARLRRGVGVEQALAELDVLRMELPEAARRFAPRITVQPLQEGLFFLYRTPLWLVVTAGAVGLVIACVNLSTLLLARSRSTETARAIRLALGASTARIVAGTAMEATLVSIAGAALAIVVCLWTREIVLGIVPPEFRGFAVSPVDLRLLALSVATTVLVAVVASVAPAWHARGTDPIAALQAGGRSAGRRLRGAGTLLAMQAGFGAVLVAGAALMVGSYVGLVTANPGWQLDDLYVMAVNHGFQRGAPPSADKARVPQIVDIIEQTPGVVAAGAATIRPFDRYGLIDDAWEQLGHTGGMWGVTPGLVDAMRLSLRAGRFLTEADVVRKELVVVLSETAVRKLWPDATPGDALGRRVRTGDGERAVVGVISDVRRYPGEAPIAAMYVPLTADEVRLQQSAVEVLVRMQPGYRPDVGVIRRLLDERFGRNSAFAPQLIADMLAPYYDRPRFLAALFGTLAAIALALAAIGVFALAAFDVARRRYEMAVRITLGATHRDLRRLIQRGLLHPILIGCAAGLLAAWWAAQFAQSLVTEMNVRHPARLIFVAVVFALIAMLAARLPVRRIARTSPGDVLRSV